MSIEEKISQAQEAINSTYSNYVGNKKKLCSWIANCAYQEGVLTDQTYFIDLFGGSGSVSYFLSQLGLSGCINELLFASHSAHCSMFGQYKHSKELDQTISKEVPVDVNFKRYIYSSIKDTVKKSDHKKRSKKFFEYENDAFSQMGIQVDKKVFDQVSIEVDFESHNIIFTELMRVFTPWIETNFSAKEAFELSCVLTNSIMDGINEFDLNQTNVKCFQGDASSFLKSNKWKQDLDNTLIYLDPPYGVGNANSKYHFIYYLAEVMAYAVHRLYENYTKAIKVHGKDKAHLLMEPVPDALHNVDLLPHIKEHSLKFATKKYFNEHFDQLLNNLMESKIPVWIFSFSGETNFSSARDIAKILNRYCSTVSLYTIPYDYHFRGVLSLEETKDNEKSLEGLVLGDKHSDVGKKTTSENEVLFICKV